MRGLRDLAVLLAGAASISRRRLAGGVFAVLVSIASAGAQDDKATAPSERLERTSSRAIAAALHGHEFDRVSRSLDELRRLGRKRGTFRTHFELACQQVLVAPGVAEHLDAWCAVAPGSAYAHLLRGLDLIARAGHSQQPQQSRRLLEEAEADLEWATLVDLRLPQAPAARIEAGLLLGLAREEMLSDFEHAVRIDARCVTAYERMLQPLTTEFGGEAGQALAFARAVVDGLPEEAAMSYLIVVAHLDAARESGDAHYFANAEIDAEMRGAFATVLDDYPDAVEVWQRRAEWANWIGDRRMAAAAVRRTRELTAEADSAPAAPPAVR